MSPIYRDSHGEIFSRPRKDYVRSKPYPAHITRFRALPREKTAIIKLRKLGYSMQNIAKGLGRSTSYIHDTIKKAQFLGLTRRLDNRKRPRKAILFYAKRRLIQAYSAIQQWQAFIFGEEDRPP